MSTPADAEPASAVLRLLGEVDFFSEDGYRAEAEQLLGNEHVKRFVVDLGGVEAIDSSGLSLLVDILRLCRELGVEMVLRDVPERVRQLLDLTGLDQVLAVEGSSPA